MSPDQRCGREVMQTIREVLMRDWDPIGVAGIPEAADEYDMYIASVYRILVDTRSEDELVSFLFRTETQTMGLSPSALNEAQEVMHKSRLKVVARKLLALGFDK